MLISTIFTFIGLQKSKNVKMLAVHHKVKLDGPVLVNKNVCLPAWPWNSGQGHQYRISPIDHPKKARYQVWSNSSKVVVTKNQKVSSWPWNWGQGHQHLIRSRGHPKEVSHQVWRKFIQKCALEAADKVQRMRTRTPMAPTSVKQHVSPTPSEGEDSKIVRCDLSHMIFNSQLDQPKRKGMVTQMRDVASGITQSVHVLQRLPVAKHCRGAGVQ